MNPIARRIGLTVLLLFISLAGIQGQAPVDSGAYFRQVIAESTRLPKLVAEAKAGTQYRIGFAAALPGLFQGYTSFDEGADHNGITVHVTAGLSRALTENLLAHEIFHIILSKQGFLRQVYSPPSRTYAGELIADAAQSLLDCYADAHIDELMSARGFTPKLLNRREADLVIEDARKATGQPLEFSLWRKVTALSGYCLAIRERDFEMEDIFRAWQHLDPMLANDVSLLEQQAGTTRCKDAQTCMEATKRLRRVSGFDGTVQLLNPFTRTWE